jgi:hypothetical protein
METNVPHRATLHRVAALLTALVLASAAAAFLPSASSSARPADHASEKGAFAPALSRRAQVNLTYTPEMVASTHQYTQAQAVALATRFDVIIAMPVSFSKYVAQMKAANPHLTLLAYSNAMFSTPTTASGLPEAAYAHTTKSARIKSNNFHQTLMEPTNAQWLQRTISLCQQALASSGYDGCFEDMLGMAVYDPGYVTGLPAVPATGQQYTATQWRSALVNLVGSFRASMAGKPLVGNAVGNAWSYWHNSVNTQPIVSALPGAQMELFTRAAADPVTKWPTVPRWLDYVNTIKSLETQRITGLFGTKLFVNATTAQVKQWEAYSMSSFLMQANGYSYWAFTTGTSQAGATGANNPFSMPANIGGPTGAMQASSNGTYSRTFANGIAVVNPGSTTVTVQLPQRAKDLDGTWRTSVTLAAHSGSVLVYS